MNLIEKMTIVGVIFTALTFGYTIYRGEFPRFTIPVYNELTPQAREWLKKHG